MTSISNQTPFHTFSLALGIKFKNMTDAGKGSMFITLPFIKQEEWGNDKHKHWRNEAREKGPYWFGFTYEAKVIWKVQPDKVPNRQHLLRKV